MTGTGLGRIVADGELDTGQRVAEEDARAAVLVFLLVGLLADLAGGEQDVLLVLRRCRSLVGEGDGVVGIVIVHNLRPILGRGHAEEEGHLAASLFPGVITNLTAPAILAGKREDLEGTVADHLAGSTVDDTVEGIAIDAGHVLRIGRGATGLGCILHEVAHFGNDFLQGKLHPLLDFAEVIVVAHDTCCGRRLGTRGDPAQHEAHLARPADGSLDVFFTLAGAHQGSHSGYSRDNQILSHGCRHFRIQSTCHRPARPRRSH